MEKLLACVPRHIEKRFEPVEQHEQPFAGWQQVADLANEPLQAGFFQIGRSPKMRQQAALNCTHQGKISRGYPHHQRQVLVGDQRRDEPSADQTGLPNPWIPM